MRKTSNKDLFEQLNKIIKKRIGKIKDEDFEEAINNMLLKSNIKNLSEYLRIYKYRNAKKEINYDFIKYSYNRSGDLVGHSGQIERLAFDNSSKFFFSTGNDGIIKCWDIKTGFVLNSFIGHRTLINDLCFSKDGTILVSCDSSGIINIWNLFTFDLILTIQCSAGVVFSEFFEIIGDENYNLVCILSNGFVSFYKFNNEKIISQIENDFTIEEPYKAICITDGGRFLLRAGYWPYLILIDTHNPDKCFVFDTNGLTARTICAAKDCLRFAAGCGNWIFQWTFFCEGSSSYGNFNKINKDVAGYWRKITVKIDMDDSCFIDNMCFLKNNNLVCVCSDMKIRIFSDRICKVVINVDLLGSVCPHPIANIFAYCGTFVCFYTMDTLISYEKYDFIVSDFQFSNDGEYFVIGDEIGTLRVYKLTDEIFQIKEQFFSTDFDHLNNVNTQSFLKCNLECTTTINKEVNKEWKLLPYEITSTNNTKNVKIEDMGMEHFISKLMDKDEFKKKYCIFSVEPTAVAEDEESISSLEMSESSEESDIAANVNVVNVSSEDEVIMRRRTAVKTSVSPSVPLRRTYVEESAIPLRRTYNEESSIPLRRTSVEEPVVYRGIRLRRNDTNENPGLEFQHYRRNKRTRKTSNSSTSTEDDEILVRRPRTNNLNNDNGPRIRLRRHRNMY